MAKINEGAAAKPQPTEKQQTAREKLLERLRGRNSELNIDDDEAVAGQISSDYDLMDQREEERKAFNEMLSSNPYAAPLITGLATGKNDDGSDFDLGEWFLDNEPDLLIDLIEGNPKNKEKYRKKREQRKKDADEEAAFQSEIDGRLQKLDEALDAAAEEAGYKPEDTKDLVTWIFGNDGLLMRGRKLEFTKDDFTKLIRMKDYDNAVKRAADEGYVKGKNEKIDMTRHRESKRKLPVLPSGGGTPSSKEENPMLQHMNELGKVY